MTITDEKYQQYKQEVEKYEERQAKIKEFKEQMGEILRKYKGFYLFKYHKNQVIFTICTVRGMKITIAECSEEDKYEKDLGKIIAVFKAFNIPIEEVVELVEPKPKYATGGFMNFEEIDRILRQI